MISRNLKDFRTFVKEREFFVLENKVNFSEKIEPKDVKELRRLVKNKKIPLGNIIVNKGFYDKNNHDFFQLFYNTKRTDFSGIEKWDVSKIKFFLQAFWLCDHFTGKEIENWDISGAITIDQMFQDCPNFNANLSKWKVEKIVFHELNEVFWGCINFTGKGLENWNVRNITSMDYLFAHCEKFNTDLSKWDVSNVENLRGAFAGCKNFTGKGLEKWNLSKVENCKNIFMNSGVKNIPENFRKKAKELGQELF